jgi:hypothetical protein
MTDEKKLTKIEPAETAQLLKLQHEVARAANAVSAAEAKRQLAEHDAREAMFELLEKYNYAPNHYIDLDTGEIKAVPAPQSR